MECGIPRSRTASLTMSAIGKAENIYSVGAFPFLTYFGSQQPPKIFHSCGPRLQETALCGLKVFVFVGTDVTCCKYSADQTGAVEIGQPAWPPDARPSRLRG